MSPVSPALVAPASLSGVSGLLGIPSGFVDIVDFNGTATQLPFPTGPDRVGVHHFTVNHDLGFRFSPPAVCSDANASLPQLRAQYGQDGVSYFDEACSGLRHISVSVFYPACDSSQQPQSKIAPVFTQSLLETITKEVFGDTYSMHNMESQASLDVPTCPDKYPMIILSPPVGSQRQAYTQLASDIASYHHVVVTVDHAFQSSAIESENGDVLFNLAGELIKPREANSGRVIDLMAVALHFNDSSNLSPVLWSPGTEIDLANTFVFGHGQGGLVARMMVASNLLSAGGTLDHLVRMPAPYNERNVFYQPRHNGTSTIKPQPTPNPGTGDDTGDRLGDIAGQLGDSLGERLKNMARGLRKTMMDSLSTLICRVLGTCGTLVQKRDLAIAFHEHEGWDEHEDKPCDNVCFYHCKEECKPEVPHGFFPDNLGKSAGKTRPDNGDWTDDWEDYQNHIGDYKGFPGRNPYRHHEDSCYDDYYCYKKCCFDKDHDEDDHNGVDGHGGHREHHWDPEDGWDRQDEGRVPDRWGEEDNAPSSGRDFEGGAKEPFPEEDDSPDEAVSPGAEDDLPEDDEDSDEQPLGDEAESLEDDEDNEGEL